MALSRVCTVQCRGRVVRTKALESLAKPLRRITHHLTLAQFPIAKTDFNIARAFLLGCFAGDDQRNASIALARILRGPHPLDRWLREMLAEEIELTAEGKGRILQFKSAKRRMDPHRSLFIALTRSRLSTRRMSFQNRPSATGRRRCGRSPRHWTSRSRWFPRD
jgi:hypothetical protein